MDRLTESERLSRMADQLDSIESMLVADTPAAELLERFRKATAVLDEIVSYQREQPATASAHCMRRSVEDALNILRGVQL